MKSVFVLSILCVCLFVVGTQAAVCDPPAKDSDDGEVTVWFKSLGCKIQKGAEDLQESAKPWAEKIGTSAKDFGSSVAQKYDEIKHKLTDDSDSASSPTALPVHNAPTEKVPLAPLGGNQPAVAPAVENNQGNAAAAAVAPAPALPAKTA